jgi:hypothetical protein
MVRRVFDRLSDKTLENLFKVIIKDNLQNLISFEGDMDFQRSIILKLLKRKEIIKIFTALMRFK